MRNKPPNKLYSTAECAAELQVTDGRIRQLCRGTGRGTKLGRDWFMTAADVAALRKHIRPKKN